MKILKPKKAKSVQSRALDFPIRYSKRQIDAFQRILDNLPDCCTVRYAPKQRREQLLRQYSGIFTRKRTFKGKTETRYFITDSYRLVMLRQDIPEFPHVVGGDIDVNEYFDSFRKSRVVRLPTIDELKYYCKRNHLTRRSEQPKVYLYDSFLVNPFFLMDALNAVGKFSYAVYNGEDSRPMLLINGEGAYIIVACIRITGSTSEYKLTFDEDEEDEKF